ncbi:hypothetical protein [Chitinophaga flava]|uniref:Uncharacterized protein n=1 Tax=Chitinophaga flava TaxID=2259036 RepID=A0A365XUD9_9BACT|nr:hypothetical protein [Chitinophaga flava]RBL89314.1 hypothetical protein DF182_22595 [Chitinophaga flava]
MDFRKTLTDKLFVAIDAANDRGFMAFVTPDTPPDKDVISLSEALTNNSWAGSFVIGAKGPDLKNKDDADKFLEKIFNIVGTTRQFLWVPDMQLVDVVYNGRFTANGNSAIFDTSVNLVLTPSLNFVISSGVNIRPDDDGNNLLLDNGRLAFDGPSTPQMQKVVNAAIPCIGSYRGCVQFTGFIERTSLLTNLQWGFQLLIPSDGVTKTRSEWMPFSNPNIGPTEYIGFNITLDATDTWNEVFDPCNTEDCSIATAYPTRRTFFDFTGKNFLEQDVALTSYFTTVFGQILVLIPGTPANAAYNARLVFSLSDRNANAFDEFHLCPEGDFIITIPATQTASNHCLLCGMSGTEFFNFTPQTTSQKGDVLRFLSRKPAYAPVFPIPSASPVAAPTDFNQSPLNTQFRTSWAMLVNNSGNKLMYVSQPDGAAFYGMDALIEPQFNDLLGHTAPGFDFMSCEKAFFPMFPYAGMIQTGSTMPAATVNDIEKTIIAPMRRKIIAGCTAPPGNPGEDKKKDTTPDGIIVDITPIPGRGTPKWNEILLGWNIDNNIKYTLSFIKPADQLVTAFQSSEVMLVIANNSYTGNFQNDMSINDWGMKINTGLNQRYNDYRNVIIIKGRKGKLYDAKKPENSLVANPLKWTQARDFAIPSTISGNDDEAELTILSQWLQTYFEKAAANTGNPYFKRFNDIAQSDSWTGVLFLRVDVTHVPVNLSGMLAGIVYPAGFNVHHLGIDISPVRKGTDGPEVDKPSSIFGLIYYVDPDFRDVQPVKTIAPSSNEDYNYRLLSLKVLFENTTVKSFESNAQLTLNKIFGSPVSRMRDPENIYRNVLLTGTMQITNGVPLYILSSRSDDAFYLDSNIISKIEVNNVTMSTRSGRNDAITTCWFSIAGFIDYYPLKDPDTGAPFDIFSFGNLPEQDLLRKGLNFSNLGLLMTFAAANPAISTLVFNASEIAFDLSLSTARRNSLYNNLLLDLDSLVAGTDQATPKESGYLEVLPDLRMNGVSGKPWWGLRMKLNMGSPGELAGKINLNSWLLVAWSPDSVINTGFNTAIGISLPGTESGARMISLQNVMKLSIGQIRLLYILDKESFLLLFTDIALRFLGLLKIPPNGNTLFYLFGNPDAGGKASGLGWYAMYAKA